MSDGRLWKRRRVPGGLLVGSPLYVQEEFRAYGLSVARADVGDAFKPDGGGTGSPEWVPRFEDAELGISVGTASPPAMVFPVSRGGRDDANYAADALDEDGGGAKTRPGLD